MAITNLTVSNFKSFKHLDLALGRFNVVIGANASGKSNFVEIFRFLKTLEDNNLNGAISLHGGRESVLNKKLGPSELLRMQVTSGRHMTWAGGGGNTHVDETTYGFSLQVGSPPSETVINDDYLTQKLLIKTNGEDIKATFRTFMSNGERQIEIDPFDAIGGIIDGIKDKGGRSSITRDVYLRSLSLAMDMGAATTLLIERGFFGFMGPRGSLFEGVGAYDIDPRAIKRRQEEAGIPRLQENGENLALVLKQILVDPEKRRMFHNLLQDILPFAVEIGTEEYLGSVLLKLREEYYTDSLLAGLLSDGTVNVVALITALYFEDKDVVIIEEPERNIHPHLISRLVGMMKDASRKKKDASREKQVIVTTHSPEIVRQAGVENLLLITRDEDGFSMISRPADKEEVRIFLENDLGLDEVFVQELWGM